MNKTNEKGLIFLGTPCVGTSSFAHRPSVENMIILSHKDAQERIVVSVDSDASPELIKTLEDNDIVVINDLDRELFNKGCIGDVSDSFEEAIKALSQQERMNILNGKQTLFQKNVPFYQERGMKRNKKAFHKKHW